MDTQRFNTDHLQTYPDNVQKEPDDVLIKKNNNPRYKFFKQNHFTAGDEDQFLEFWDRSTPMEGPLKRNQMNLNPEIPLHANTKLPKYRNLCVDHIIQTFHYISDKFKKGLFLKITDGNPKVFLPFSKVDYQNEWSKKIKTNPRRFNNIMQLMKYTSDVEKREFMESKVHKNVKAWYGNNGLVRLEFPISEGDSGVNMLHDMFTTLCRERKLPSCELFLNKRDFPLLKKDDTEAYNSFFGYRTKLLSHSYEKYAPILSMTTSELHADIPIPTWEDWSRIAYWHESKMFGKEYRKFPRPEEFDAIEWADKIPTAIFRGASTGQGTMIENNIRLAMAAESSKCILDDDSIPLLDAGITKWNLRPRKHPCFPYIETIHVEEMPFGLVPSMSPLEQAQYKYILHLPGHSEAYRLGMELFSGSVVLYHPCEYQLWFFKWLVPWEHYIPLTGSIDDLYEKIKWCKANDSKCEKIVDNAKKFANKYLTRDAVLDYLQNTLWDLYTTTGKIEHVSNNMTTMNTQLYECVKSQMTTNMFGFYKDNNSMMTRLESLMATNHTCLSKDIKQWLWMLFGSKFTLSKSVFKEGKNTTLCVFTFGGQKYAIKKTKATWKHEDKFQLACSYLYINELSKHVPNFIYTYADFKDSENTMNIVSDFIEGLTLEEYINTSHFNMSILIDILLAICLALDRAQQQCGFLHMDLYPWNIVVSRLKEPVTHHYKTQTAHIELTTNVVPFIIDYGKSHFVHKGNHYYNTNPFYMCRLQDIISIVFSSIYMLLEKHKLYDRDIRFVIQIMNFFSGSEYTNKTSFMNIGHVKSFLKKHKKFSKMLSEPKIGLEEKSPMDFFNFLMCKFPKNTKVVMTDICPRVMPTFQWLGIYFGFLEKVKMRALELELIKETGLYKEWSPVDFRKHWLILEGLWRNIPTDSLENSYLYIYNTRLVFEEFGKLIMIYEETDGNKVWDNLTMEAVSKDFPKIPTITLLNEMDCLELDKIKHGSLPNYPTHICKSCLSKQKCKAQPTPLFDKYQQQRLIAELEMKNGIDFFPCYKSLCYSNTLKTFCN